MALNYMDKILTLRACGLLPITAGLHNLEVRHDDDCPALAGKPECTCEPDLYFNGKMLKLPLQN